jgi:hypothetical protein
MIEILISLVLLKLKSRQLKQIISLFFLKRIFVLIELLFHLKFSIEFGLLIMMC